jgi:hypothetical protein
LRAAGTSATPDHRRIRGLAIGSLIVLAAAGAVHVSVPPALAPRVNVRWADSVTDAERARLESRLQLFAGELREGTTWAYDLGDPSVGGVRALVTEPSVADTHYVNRRLGTVSSDAPAGTTLIARGVLSRWRDSPAAPWAARLSASCLIVSALWLLINARGRRVERRVH